MAKCLVCNSQKGKRQCIWKKGFICSPCCGITREQEFCTDCPYYQVSKNISCVDHRFDHRMAVFDHSSTHPHPTEKNQELPNIPSLLDQSGRNDNQDYISETSYSLIHKDDFDIHKEIDYLLETASKGTSKVILLDGLILFSTNKGDAWIIDFEYHGAHCLMQGFEKQPFEALNTEDSFYIEWEERYAIENNNFFVYRDGRAVVFYDYPVSEIKKMIARAGR